jgi:DNA repair photolyase
MSHRETSANMRPQADPPNCFHRQRCELDLPAAARPRVIEEQARSILTQNDSPDVPFRWSVNPYRGCAHACAYCFGRRTHEYLDLDAGQAFDTQLFVKINAPELLAAALRRPGWKREFITFSGVTDCYQPLEEQYRITRRCLEVCSAHANPVAVVTKSQLVLRDVDLLGALQERRGLHVLISIPLADARVAQVLEPGAPSPDERFAVVRQLRAAGIRAGVFVAPVIPGLGDRDIPALVSRAAECGATAIECAPIRLPGHTADVFLQRLRAGLPDVATRVEARIRELHGGQLNEPEYGCRVAGRGEYWAAVRRLLDVTARRAGLCRDFADEREAAAGPRQLSLF